MAGIAKFGKLPKVMLLEAKEEIKKKLKNGLITKDVAEQELKMLDEQLKEPDTDIY